MRRLIGIGAALALAACGGGGDDKGAGNQAGGNATGNAGAGNEAAGGNSGGGGAVAMRPGQWEITTEVVRMSVPNMPQGVTPPTPPPTTVRSCMTPEQAAQPNADFFSGSGESAGCTYENSSIGGGRIQATVQCNSGGTTMRSTMSGQFAADSFELTQQVRTGAEAGMAMEMESRTRGRRVGDCPG